MNRHRPIGGGTPAPKPPATTTTTPSVTKHARTPSANVTATPVGPAAPLRASLFITNLRLLDLDLLPDWPEITLATFTGTDVRQRIRAAEFALYHLFRLYNPAVTAEKLQPFFPPLEPLQSVNLRAALYRCLAELKKSGILSREILLRKTMLDDCSGDKFAELCLALSAEVLRKKTRERKVKHIRPAAERMSIMPSPVKDSLLPLAVAHKASLSKVLERKQKQCETYAWLYDTLLQKEAELQDRRAAVELNLRKKSSPGQAEKAQAVEQGLNMHWLGNGEFRNAIINGDECTTGDAILANPFNDFWRSQGDVAAASMNSQMGVLEDLEQRVNQQSQRMRGWQAAQDRILKKNPSSASDGSPSKPAQAGSLRLDKHRDLNTRDAPQMPSPPPSPERTEKDVAAVSYDEILTAMREQLRYGRTPATLPTRRNHTAPAISPRKVSDTRAGARDGDPGSPPPTTVPIRPFMSRTSSISSAGNGSNHVRVASRSRSYHAPKVDSQRQPIALKTEACSPRKGSVSSTTPPYSASSDTASTEDPHHHGDGDSQSKERDESPEARADSRMRSVSWRASQYSQTSRTSRISQSSEMDRTIDSGVGLGIDSDEKRSSVDVSHLTNEDVEPCAAPQQYHSSRPSITPVRQSLAERTRMSMAFNRPFGETPLSPILAESPAEPSTSHINPDREALMERTRHSMSFAPKYAPTSVAKSAPRHARTQSAYDASCATPLKNPPMQRRDITPRDEIFSPDATYDSVFKTRPKIKLSPVISPRSDMDTSGLEGMIDSPHGSVVLGETY